MTLAEQYAKICIEEKKLQEQKKVIGQALLEHFMEKKVKKLDTTIGKFTVVSRKVYRLDEQYLEAINEHKKDIKELTKEAEELAKAEGSFDTKEHLLYTPIK